MLFFLCLVKRTYVMNSFSLFCNILSSVLFVFSDILRAFTRANDPFLSARVFSVFSVRQSLCSRQLRTDFIDA